jgi:hypothetical protein
VEKALPIPRRRTGAIAFPGCAHEGLLQQCGVHLLLADRIAGSVGGPDRYWNSLASVAWVPGGNLLGRYERGLFCECVQNPTHHCVLTGPLFLVGAILLLSSDFTHIKPMVIWIGIFAGTGMALLLEWRYARRLSAAACDS